MIDNPKQNWLQKSELDKIKAECKDKCCNPCTNELHCHESQQFVDRVNTTISEAATEHSESPVADKKNETTILEDATKHSIIRRLLILADENPKSGKGTASHAREKSPVPNDAADNEVSVATAVPTLTPQQMPLTPPMNSDDEIPVATTESSVTDSESSVTDDDYESWLQRHAYST